MSISIKPFFEKWSNLFLDFVLLNPLRKGGLDFSNEEQVIDKAGKCFSNLRRSGTSWICIFRKSLWCRKKPGSVFPICKSLAQVGFAFSTKIYGAGKSREVYF